MSSVQRLKTYIKLFMLQGVNNLQRKHDELLQEKLLLEWQELQRKND